MREHIALGESHSPPGLARKSMTLKFEMCETYAMSGPYLIKRSEKEYGGSIVCSIFLEL